MDNPTQYMVEQIYIYFLDSASKRDATSLIKVHNSKLSQFGDITFPLNPDIWRNYFHLAFKCENNIFNLKSESDKDSLQTLLKCGQTWVFSLGQVKIINDRCSLFLNRKNVTECLLNKILIGKDYGMQSKDPKKMIRIAEYRCSDEEVLSEYRARLVHKTLKKLVEFSNWKIVDDNGGEENVKTVSVVSVVTKRRDCVVDPLVTELKCGTVLDSQDGKLARISPNEYVRLRSTDMRLMAMHKYGVRVKDDTKFCDLFVRLGQAAVTVDLLEVKPSSPVNMIRSGQGSTKGASFILYNSARLETLLRSFDERVQNGSYEKLPPLSDIDVSLLTNEEEWELVYGYIFAFPHLISRCIGNFDSGTCGVHFLIKYLDGLVSTFSVYYRRIRILTETRAHLMPYVYARIYLLKAIREIFNIALGLLDIEPVEFM